MNFMIFDEKYLKVVVYFVYLFKHTLSETWALKLKAFKFFLKIY